jgi:hypothetical protein
MGNVVWAHITCGFAFVQVSPFWFFFRFLNLFLQSDIALPGPNAWSECIAQASNRTIAPVLDDGGGGGERRHHLRFLLEENNGAPLWDQEESPRSLAWIQPIATTTAAAASDDGGK